MRKIDKFNNILKVNLLFEQRYVNLINENSSTQPILISSKPFKTSMSVHGMGSTGGWTGENNEGIENIYKYNYFKVIERVGLKSKKIEVTGFKNSNGFWLLKDEHSNNNLDLTSLSNGTLVAHFEVPLNSNFNFSNIDELEEKCLNRFLVEAKNTDMGNVIDRIKNSEILLSTIQFFQRKGVENVGKAFLEAYELVKGQTTQINKLQQCKIAMMKNYIIKSEDELS